MKTTTFKNNWLTAAGLLLALPAAWFICINLLNESGITGPYNASQPLIESLGRNLDLLILFGPLLALMLIIFQVLKIEWQFTKEQFQVNFTIHKRWFPLLVAAFSLGLLAFLFFYAIGENCNC